MNCWKLSTLVLAGALGLSAGGPLIGTASAREAPSALQSALNHLNAAKSDLRSSERRHHHAHRAAVAATEVAIRAVEKELAWEKHRHHHGPKDPGGTPKDPGGTPKDPGGTPKDPGRTPKK